MISVLRVSACVPKWYYTYSLLCPTVKLYHLCSSRFIKLIKIDLLIKLNYCIGTNKVKEERNSISNQVEKLIIQQTVYGKN